MRSFPSDTTSAALPVHFPHLERHALEDKQRSREREKDIQANEQKKKIVDKLTNMWTSGTNR